MMRSLLVAFVSLSFAVPALSETMKIDTAKSQVNWTGRKVLVDSKHYGTVKIKSGEVTVEKGAITAGQFEIDMASIEAVDMQGKPKKGDLEGHLKSADFFEVAKYPTSTFKVTSVKALKATGQGPTHEITGDLTMKGKTQSVTFPARVAMKGKTAEATADFKIDRTQWDVRYASDKFFKGLGDKVIANDIELKLNLIATK